MSCRKCLTVYLNPWFVYVYILGVNMFFIDPINLLNTAAGKKYDVYRVH